MRMDFRNKVVAVTGGSEGIGRALVELLLQRGASVATCGRNHDKLYQLQAAFPGMPLHVLVADVSNEQDCNQFIATTISTFGGIDILINNAGLSMRALIVDAEVHAFKRLMDVNFWGMVHCTKAALPSIIERKGTVVGISSIVGNRGIPGRSAYSASKFAMQGWLEALRVEMFQHNVNVLWVSPGFIATNIRSVALNEQGQQIGETPMDESKLMSAEECAGYIINAIEKRKRTVVLTLTGKATVFISRFFPRLADKYIHQFFFKNGKLIK
ncbi:MAG: SDR family oxidoreductase [Chitinophagaceae bacterium]|nr:SDR family oxidoreductase [Chitinophagaceae bacterium]